MAKGNRIYITLNEKKMKDKIIIDFLDKQYDVPNFIKTTLYQIATNCTYVIPSGYKRCDNEQEKQGANRDESSWKGENVYQEEQKEENISIDDILDDEIINLLQ